MAKRDLLGSSPENARPENATALTQSAGTEHTTLIKVQGAKKSRQKIATAKTPADGTTRAAAKKCSEAKKCATAKTRATVAEDLSSNGKPVRKERHDELTYEAKRFIVIGLAEFQRPVDIIADLEKEFGIVTYRQKLQAYHPERKNGLAGRKEFKELFRNTRYTYTKNLHEVGISHRRHRLELLDDLYCRLKDEGNLPAAAKIVDQAEKEMHRHYTHPPKKTKQGNKQALAALLGSSIEELTLESMPDP
jgi:hypothetical protein